MNLALYDTPRVGGDILANCTRCKMELAHVIVSMVDGRPAKVQCKTCRSERKYRVRSITSSSKRKKTGPTRPRAKASVLWEEKLAANSGKPTLKYSARETFKNGDVLNHVKFGVGIVEETRGTGKIIVLFREGERLLVHGMGG